MDAVPRETGLQQRILDRRHVGARPADIGVVPGEHAAEHAQLCTSGQPLHRLQPVQHGEPAGVSPRELTKLGGEDHRALIAVGVTQGDPPGTGGQYRLQDRYHRGDPATPRPQQEVAVQIGRGELSGGGQHLDGVTGRSVVTQPIRPVPTRGALDGDLQGAIGVRRAGQRVAARHRAGPVAGDAHGQELARPVPEPVAETLGNLEHQGPRTGCLVDDLADRELDRPARMGVRLRHREIVTVNLTAVATGVQRTGTAAHIAR